MPDNVVHIFGLELTGEFETRSRAYREHLELAVASECGCQSRNGPDGFNLCREGRRLQREARRTLGRPVAEFKPDPRMTNRLRRALAEAQRLVAEMATSPHSVTERRYAILLELDGALQEAGLEFHQALGLRDAEIENDYVVDWEL